MLEKDALYEEFFKRYQDRGIKKWQGFFLSEHTAKLSEEEQKERESLRLSQQTEAEIEYFLSQSIKYNIMLKIQLNSLDDEEKIKPSIVGVFGGMANTEYLMINEQMIAFSDIRHIQFHHFQKWSNVQPFEENEQKQAAASQRIEGVLDEAVEPYNWLE